MRFLVSPLLVAASLLFEASTAKELWSSTPAGYSVMARDDYILKTGYPVGNGKLGAIPFGAPGSEKINFNVDSLWSGGPFEVNGYTGGNPRNPVSGALPDIRSNIFQNGTGQMRALLGNRNYYGSNRVLGNVTIRSDSIGDVTDYRRSLDLTTGVHTTTFVDSETSAEFTSTVFCSFPDQVCVYHLESDSSLPTLIVGLENQLVNSTLAKSSCEDGVVVHTGVTQVGPPEGMRYTGMARLGKEKATVQCTDASELELSPTGKSITIILAAETSYDQKNGNAEANWSFKGEDPTQIVEETSSKAAKKDYKKLLKCHEKDYQKLSGAFTLELPDNDGSAEIETAALIRAYQYDSPGNSYLENLLFDLSRHMLISSSRANSLPANLQGRWTELLKPSWGADYHSNINIQMNYWIADQTGLASLQHALFDYIEDTWVPRGTETARLLYNATGWVTHNEMNTFGFTAMKDQPSWANYAIAGAWMMQHVWDSFDYTQDKAWFQEQGYPLIKGTAEFWLSSLQEDKFFEDGSLVVNPCNSAETGPTTFGCVHFQQLIHQVFDAVLASQSVVNDPDEKFVQAVSDSLSRLDTGLHFASWGGLKEWKLPEDYGFDNKSTHRHLSHLNGWYPGYSISSFADGFVNETIQDAVRETLISRGMGNAEDANAGWAKVWRSACWARLNDTQKAHDHLRYAIDQNFATNGFSMYQGSKPPFQIDANFGFGGAVLSMLVTDMPLSHDSTKERSVLLGPAIPKQWSPGKVEGLRLRGGGIIDFQWDEEGLATGVEVVSKGKTGKKISVVNMEGDVLATL